MMIYTGIGSRKTPKRVRAVMQEIAQRLAKKGYTLRSGGASGADTAFEEGCDRAGGEKEIYLPWKRFNDHPSPLYLTHPFPEWAIKMAEEFHPYWSKLSSPVQKLMIRNCQQVFGGGGEEASYFVICWTKDGEVVGGTGQALRIAEHYDIPIYNLFNFPLDADIVQDRINELQTI